MICTPLLHSCIKSAVWFVYLTLDLPACLQVKSMQIMHRSDYCRSGRSDAHADKGCLIACAIKSISVATPACGHKTWHLSSLPLPFVKACKGQGPFRWVGMTYKKLGLLSTDNGREPCNRHQLSVIVHSLMAKTAFSVSVQHRRAWVKVPQL